MTSVFRQATKLCVGAALGLAVLAGCSADNPEPMGRSPAVQFEIVNVESPAFGGRSFGDVGQYEAVWARAHLAIDPSDPRNALITDLDLAPQNADGMVEYATDVHIIKPVDLSRGNGRIFYEVTNRGNKTWANFNGVGGNDASSEASAGSGLLMRHGYTMVWSGWEDADLRGRGNGRALATLPIAHNPDGSSIVGQTIVEHNFNNTTDSTFTLPFYKVANLDPAESRLLVHNHTRFVGGPLTERVEVPHSAWSYLNDSTVRIARHDPFLAPYDAGAVFELVYPAKDPVVLGLGYAATRDVVSFLRHDSTTANPLRGAIQYALAEGLSQSGRYLKGFLYWGFNEDWQGRKVFEGIMPVISGAHGMPLNDRFGDTDATGRSYERELTSKMEFPFTYAVRHDPVSGRTDGLLARCEASDTCPDVMQLDGGNEVFLKGQSLVTTDGLGRDLELPPNLRVYYFASTQHSPARTAAPTRICQQLSNSNDYRPHMRALLLALDAWATAGVRPPDSRYPKVADGTFVPSLPQSGMGFPEIPGVRYTGWYIPVALKDTTSLPNQWIPGKEYVVLVPATDADGNDIAGVRTVQIHVPVGTYTGWGLRRAPFAEGEDCALTGQFIPFAETRAEREAAGDPRLSLEERYPTHEAYVRDVDEAVDELIGEGFLLAEDGEAIKQAAAESSIPG